MVPSNEQPLKKRENIMLTVILQESYFGKEQVECNSIEEAVVIFKAWRDDNMLGSRDLGRQAGRVFEGTRRVATIAYNGRILEA
jgi:hypothetical protein